MGTTYSVRLAAPVDLATLEAFKTEIEQSLAEVNHQMSPWQSDSEISTFNQRPADAPQNLSPAFAFVIQHALSLNQSSNGAFDPTLAPLIDLWGFGPHHTQTQPNNAQIESALATVGCNYLTLRGSELSKTKEGVTLNLSAIAKGYGVDAAALVLRRHHIDNFLVEIGGEVVTSGNAPGDRPWQIGIEYPALSAEQSGQLFAVLNLSDQACATSGDYHNYRTDATGQIYSHILDPRTGRPTKSSLASVTVVADSCMLADGIATSLFVMGLDEGLKWINSMPRVEAVFLMRTLDNKIEENFSADFERMTTYKQCTQ